MSVDSLAVRARRCVWALCRSDLTSEAASATRSRLAHSWNFSDQMPMEAMAKTKNEVNSPLFNPAAL
jgi:hypothetical protein